MYDEKLISIVLPVYNGAEHLATSIESVINQTYQNWELIIVNDCSTDDTLKIALNYQKNDARIRVLSNETNLKLPKTLNVGFAEAKGDYYTWTSDDNMYMPNALCRLSQELDSDSSCVMAYSNMTEIDADGKELGTYKRSSPENIVVGNVFGASFIYRAETAKQIGEYDANLFLAEDYDYWIRIYCVGKIKHIDESLYYYRRHAGSLTETKKEWINTQTYKALEKNFLPLYTLSKQNSLHFRLFDQMMRRASDEQAEQTMQMLCSVNAGYRNYLRVKAWKAKIRRVLSKARKILKGKKQF